MPFDLSICVESLSKPLATSGSDPCLVKNFQTHMRCYLCLEASPRSRLFPTKMIANLSMELFREWIIKPLKEKKNFGHLNNLENKETMPLRDSPHFFCQPLQRTAGSTLSQSFSPQERVGFSVHTAIGLRWRVQFQEGAVVQLSL